MIPTKCWTRGVWVFALRCVGINVKTYLREIKINFLGKFDTYGILAFRKLWLVLFIRASYAVSKRAHSTTLPSLLKFEGRAYRMPATEVNPKDETFRKGRIIGECG